MSTTLATQVKHSLGWSVVLSILMIIAGILAIGSPLAAGMGVNAVLSWLVLLSGASHLAYAWQNRGNSGFMWELLVGFLCIVVGMYLLTHPLAGLASLTLMLALYLFGVGVLELISSFRLRPLQGSGWLAVNGIFTLILGIMVWREWPSSSEWTIGSLVGISMLFNGGARLILSIAARRIIA